MPSLILVATDVDGEEYDHDCLAYEVMPSGWIKLFLDGEQIAMLEPQDTEGGWYVIDYDDESEWLH